MVFIDAGVLIAAARGRGEFAQRAMQALDDPDAKFASSPFVKLEVLPKSVYHKKHEEVAFYETFFDAVSVWADPNATLIQGALDEAMLSGLSAMDALHVVAASTLGADELVTLERLDKPIHRTRLLSVHTIVSAEDR